MKKILSTITLVLAACLLIVSLAACSQKKDLNTLVVAASSTPHAEILKECVAEMEKRGYKLEIRIMDDYITPNTATEDGEVGANYFQHTPYLDKFNAENKTHLVSVAKVHYEPLGIYAGVRKSLSELADGDKIVVPNDSTNEARALLLLEANGLITLKKGAGVTATKADIESNPHNFEILEVEAKLIAGMLDEAGVAVINGNYAMEAGLKVSEALAIEAADSEAAQTYANILVVKEGHENDAAVKALAEILCSDAIKNFINSKYDKSVIPVK